MEKQRQKKIIYIEKMTCSACEAAVEGALKKLGGLENIQASFIKGSVEYSEISEPVAVSKVRAAIEAEGYQIAKEQKQTEERSFSAPQFIGLVIIILAAYLIIDNTVGFNFIPRITPSMGYLALFFVGLVTSLHCVAMCGGINLSQSLKSTDKSGENAKWKPSLLYNAGRIISYTLIGGLAGVLGSVFSFSGWAKGIVAIIAGIFMIIMGLNLFGTFPWLSKLVPRFPRILKSKNAVVNKANSPLVVGLLNGLMPCGPLQAMQLYALGTGSFMLGASSMFFFSLGTVPLMFGLGIFSSLMSSKFNKKMVQVGGVLVMVLGFFMLSRGMALSGAGLSTALPTDTAQNAASISGGVQNIETQLEARAYPKITVKLGVPVSWNMKVAAEDLNGCNGTLTIPEYQIEKKLEVGDNIIEFTPTKTGIIPYSCWMGMIQSEINVVENIGADITSSSNTSANIAKNVLSTGATLQSGTGSSCCSLMEQN